MKLRSFMPLVLAVALAGCATSEQGRARLLVPDGLGSVYSEIDMRARLALSIPQACVEDGCETGAAFRRRVAERGEMLAKVAYARYPDLPARVAHFDFSVPERGRVGTLSTAGGSVMILGGLDELALDDASLDFVIAREMGHVIARHHEENTAWTIVASVAAQLLLPVANLIRGAAAAIPVTTSVAATTTAASMVGSRVIKAVNRPDQLAEADTIALDLLRAAGHDLGSVGRAVDALAPRLARIGDDGWIAEFRESQARLDQLDCGAPWTLAVADDIALTPSASLAAAGAGQ